MTNTESTSEDLDNAVTSLLEYLMGSDKEIWRKAAESRDPDKISKVLKPVLER